MWRETTRRRDVDREVLTQTGLTDMAFVPEVEIEEVHPVVRQIVAIEPGGLCVRLPSEAVQPLHAERHVAPTDIRHLTHIRPVAAGEEGQEHLVALSQRPVNLRVHVVEVKLIVAEVLGCLQQQIHVRPAGRDQHRGFVLHERTLDHPLRRQKADAPPTVPGLLVARLARNVEHC